MHCLSVIFRVAGNVLWLVQIYDKNLSFLLREDSYFIADAYYVYCFCYSVKCVFTIVNFSLSLSFILHLSIV